MFHIFHKWKYVYKRVGFSEFEGIRLPLYERSYRICVKCGKVQKFEAWPECSFWRNLNRKEIKILKRGLTDRGSYYFFRPFKLGK